MEAKLPIALVKRIGRTLGVEISRYRPVDEQRAAAIRDFEIDLVVDVGANRGQYGRALRDWGYSGEIISFEPLAEAFAELTLFSGPDKRWTCHQLALGDDEGVVRLNRASNLASSSILDISSTHLTAAPEARYLGTEDVVMTRLDSLDLPAARSTLLKLDVQGYESHALRGGRAYLENVALIECELSIAALYEGQPRMQEMLNEICGLGFDLVGLEPGLYDRRSGKHLQFDGFFARHSSIRSVPPNPSARGLG